MGLECRGGKVECLLLGKDEVCEETTTEGADIN